MNPFTALGRLLARSKNKKKAAGKQPVDNPSVDKPSVVTAIVDTAPIVTAPVITPSAVTAPVDKPSVVTAPIDPPVTTKPPRAPDTQYCTGRHVTLAEALTTIKTALDKLATTPPTVTAAYDKAAEAQAKAKTAVDADPADWTAAGVALDTFERLTGALTAECVAQARVVAGGFATTYTGVKDGRAAGTKQIKARIAYLKDQKKADALIATGDGIAALAACPAVDVSLKAFVAVANPSDTDRAKTAQDALDLLDGMDDDMLKGKSATERAEIAFDLCATGQPDSGDRLAGLVKVYRNSKVEQAFLDQRETERAVIVDKVTKVPALAGLINAKGVIDKKDWAKLIKDPVKVLALMQDISDAQAEALGLPKLVITTFDEPGDATGTTMGGCVWTTGGPPTLDMNIHKDAVKDPTETLISILHETYHAQQDILVKKLMAGELDETDPIYPQVLLYAANKPGNGYLPPEIDQADYEAQPVEVDAETQGNVTATAVLLAMKTAKTGKKGTK